jgi:hypothetical protein
MDRAARQGVIISQTEQDRSSVLRGARERTRAEMTARSSTLPGGRWPAVSPPRRAAYRRTSAAKQASRSPITEISTASTRVPHAAFMQM